MSKRLDRKERLAKDNAGCHRASCIVDGNSQRDIAMFVRYEDPTKWIRNETGVFTQSFENFADLLPYKRQPAHDIFPILVAAAIDNDPALCGSEYRPYLCSQDRGLLGLGQTPGPPNFPILTFKHIARPGTERRWKYMLGHGNGSQMDHADLLEFRRALPASVLF